jgi:predicted DNA-binding transcriptional regulator AlpA
MTRATQRPRLGIVGGAACEAVGSVSAPESTAPPLATIVPSVPIEPLLTRADLLAVLRCGTATLDRLRSAGRLPRADLYLGRSPRWRRSTIETWIAKGGGS